MNILDELLTLLLSRSRKFEREAKNAITEELHIIYRAKAAEAYAIYTEIYNRKMKLMKGVDDAEEDY